MTASVESAPARKRATRIGIVSIMRVDGMLANDTGIALLIWSTLSWSMKA